MRRWDRRFCCRCGVFGERGKENVWQRHFTKAAKRFFSQHVAVAEAQGGLVGVAVGCGGFSPAVSSFSSLICQHVLEVSGCGSEFSKCSSDCPRMPNCGAAFLAPNPKSVYDATTLPGTERGLARKREEMGP